MTTHTVQADEGGLVAAEARSREGAAEVAMGNEQADVVVRDGRIVDVFTGRIVVADVAIAGERIASVGDVSRCVGSATEQVDASGAYVLPGFVEPHLHIGSSQLSIERLAEVLVPRGTVAMSTCFYEPAVVCGPEATEALLDRSVGTGLDVLFSPFGAALGEGDLGASRTAPDDLMRFLAHERCVELRESSFPNSKRPGSRAFWLEAMRRKLVIGGHLEGLQGPILQASVALGACSDHETTTAEEALEKARAGVIVQAREGSAARDLAPVVRAITELGADARCFAFSTDEQELDSLVHHGHMDHKLRLAVREGVAPVDAVRMATLAGARSLGVERNYGAVAAGRVASLVLVNNLADFGVRRVIAQGRLAGEDHRYLLDSRNEPYPAGWLKTVHLLRPLTAQDFELNLSNSRVRVIGLSPGSLVTRELEEQVELDGAGIRPGSGLATIAVVDRHQGSGRVGLGLIRGLDIAEGAVATTINPGMANLMVIGTDAEMMALAANRVAELDGGIVTAARGGLRAEVALPLFGILSQEPLERTIESCDGIAQSLRDDLGCPHEGVLSSAGFATLPSTIPELKVCEYGLVRVERMGGRELVPIQITTK
jgi:adenine deaminase